MSLHFAERLTIEAAGSVTIEKCESARIYVKRGARLFMEDSHVSELGNYGGEAVRCEGEMTMTQCTVEGNSAAGVIVHSYTYVIGEASAELVDCVIRKN